MTVADLISILQRNDPAAVVVLRWEGDASEMQLTCEELRRGEVHAVQLHKLPASSSWYDPLGGSVLYQPIDDENDHRPAVPGVLLG